MAYYWNAPKIFEYMYGSQVYGTANENSDADYLVVVDGEPLVEEEKFGNDDFHYISLQKFQTLLESNDIKALECFYAPDYCKLHLSPSYTRYRILPEPIVTIDPQKLRHSISAICSNSWVKGKKKILVENEKYIGLKSIFHCIRIMEFANQILLINAISYNSMNFIYNDLMELDGEKELLWKKVRQQFEPLYKSIHHTFKTLTNK